MEKKYLSIPFELKQNDEDNDFFYFEGYGSTFGNVDLGDDIVEKGAFKDSLDKFLPKLLWQHKMSEPLGIFETAFEDSKGLFLKGKMPKTDDFVKGRVIPQMKIGSVNSMSIGFNILEREFDKNIRRIKKVELFEVSLVTLPMNPEAVVTDMKAVVPFKDLALADKDMAWDSTAAIKRIRKFTNSEESPSATYKNAFLWYDTENVDEFGAYKLPYADVVDGVLKAVPRGVFAVAGVLQGARGGIDIPESDQDKIKSNVEKYYSKMDLVAPWQKSIDDIKDLKDINNFLKDYGMSKSKREGIMAKMRDVMKAEDNESKSREASDSKGKSCDIGLTDLIKSNIESINNLTTNLKEKE